MSDAHPSFASSSQTSPGNADFQPLAIYRRLLGYTIGHWKIFIVAAIGMARARAPKWRS